MATLANSCLNMHWPTETYDAFVSAKAEPLRNKEHKQKVCFGFISYISIS